MDPCPPPDPAPHAASFVPPAGAVDCHAHVFGPAERYSYSPTRTYTPPDAPLSAYRHMLDTLGLARGVIVQPSVYGTDNRASLDAVAEAGEAMRMVAVVADDVSEAELNRLHEAGVRGVRLNLLFAGADRNADLSALAARIAPLGWHLQVLIDVSAFGDVAAAFGALPVPVVFDHMGHMNAGKGVDEPGFRQLLKLLADGRGWAKLSGAYRITNEAEPPYGDVAPIARALIAANPERCVFGTDWPHPRVDIKMPNDGALLSMLDDWADGPTRDRILTTNAWTLYDFPEPH